MSRPFHLVDVFGDRPLAGNPLAVVSDADGLETEEMLELTRWFNLSETSFLLPSTDPSADYRVRIFTMAGELPFAGHPTLGTCHVWAAAAGLAGGRVVQECGAGLVPLRIDEGLIWFLAPPIVKDGAVEEKLIAKLAGMLGIARGAIVSARWVDNGPRWVGVLLRDAESVLALEPDFGGETELDVGVVGFYPEGSPAAYEVRALFVDHHGRMVEDPVTGSLNASVAQWMLEEGRVGTPYRASQGARVGRKGVVHIDGDEEGVWVGGATHTVGAGRLDI
jgi:PhzF family phenazine biosynthesis protein